MKAFSLRKQGDSSREYYACKLSQVIHCCTNYKFKTFVSLSHRLPPLCSVVFEVFNIFTWIVFFSYDCLSKVAGKGNTAEISVYYSADVLHDIVCFKDIERADIEGSKRDVAKDDWQPQVSYSCGNFSDTSCYELSKVKIILWPANNTPA